MKSFNEGVYGWYVSGVLYLGCVLFGFCSGLEWLCVHL